MPKQVIPFSGFLIAAWASHEAFINKLHAYLQENASTLKFNSIPYFHYMVFGTRES